MSHVIQKIVPNLWFDDQAEHAVQFYTSLFEGSKTGAITRYGKEGFEIHGQPEGRVMTVNFELAGYEFIALNGGPYFKFTPAISFFVVCETAAEIDTLWERLSEGGTALMELGKYEWSEKYGWVQDRYGLTWQISLGKLGEARQKITPSFLFVGDQFGKAEEAMSLYTTVFDDSAVANILFYGHEEQDQERTVKYAQFSLNGEMFVVMDGAGEHPFTFNEAVSLVVMCESQKEIDYFWDKLSDGGDPKAQQCGWLKDKFGVSWQVAPVEMNEMMQDPDPQKVARVTKAFLRMKKFDIAELKRAFEGT